MFRILKPGEKKLFADYIGDDGYERLRARSHICIPLEKGAYFIMLPFMDIRGAAARDEMMYIYCSPEDFVFLGGGQRCAEELNRLPPDEAPFRLLLSLLLALTADDVETLEKLENGITALEDGIITSKKPLRSVEERIVTLRRSLFRMKRYYERLSIVTSALAEDEYSAIPPELERRFKSLDRRADHLLDSVLHLREYITQVREAYQAQIDIEQNQIMKIFTVITAVFLPLTLIVGWYGMNVKMPEYGWRWGYAYVAALSVAVCAACFAVFKRKKWF